MTKLDHPLARRSVIKGAGLGLVAGGMASTMPSQGSAATGEDGEIWSSEYWAKKGDIPLWMYRKRLGTPQAGQAGLIGTFPASDPVSATQPAPTVEHQRRESPSFWQAIKMMFK